MVFCFLLPLGSGLRLLALLLLLLHLLLLLLPFFHEATRDCVLPLSLICSTNSDQNFEAPSISNTSCSPLQTFLVRLIYIPSFEVFNLHFFCSQLLILVYGWSKRSLLLHTLFLHLILATAILVVGVLFSLRIHSPHGPLLLITLVPRCHYFVALPGKIDPNTKANNYFWQLANCVEITNWLTWVKKNLPFWRW